MTKPATTISTPASATRLLRPGIRASFIIGMVITALLMLIVTATAIISSASMSQGVDGIVQSQLPATLTNLRLARAGDALAASGASLVAVQTAEDRAVAMADVESARQSLAVTLSELTGSIDADSTTRITQLSNELNHNLDNLRNMVDNRLALIEQQRLRRLELQSLLPAFQQQATYRVRMLEGDSAVMTLLAQRTEPPFAQIGEIAARTAPLIPLARFYAQVEAIGSRILVASQDPTPTALALSEEVIDSLLMNAAATLARLPDDVAAEFLVLFEQLQQMAQSETGLTELRRRELQLVAEAEVWNAENRQILARLDRLTGDLVDHELAAIYAASAAVASMNQLTFWLLLSVATLGVLGLAAFFYLHIIKDVLTRLSLLSESMQEIAAGKYDLVLPPSGSDELGRLGAAVQQFHAVAVSASQREEKLQTLNHQLAELSILDPLTGLANRRRFDTLLAEEWSRSSRHGHTMAILMIDADYFKAYNDCYGHQAGDQCLQTIASVIQARVHRPGDLAARYGGEEFCVILSESSLDGALQVAGDIHQTIAQLELPHLDSIYGHITVSIGVAALIPSPGQPAADLLKQADLALYEAKAAGRNQVIALQAEA